MRILTAKEIKEVEVKAFASYTTEGELMFKAGEACFKKIVSFIENPRSKSFCVVCGNGKNAGDGFVIAKLLHNYGCKAQIVLADQQPSIEEPLLYFNQALESGVAICNFDECDFDCDVIVDCIFGIGFHGEPRTPFDKVFDRINQSSKVVISVDTPSGTDATTGQVVSAVKADYTIAISTLKFSHVLPPSNEYCGKTCVVNIGIPEICYEDSYVNTITKKQVKSFFVKRKINAHKGSCGHQLNVCGSYLMPGAAVICAKAGLKTGAGLVKCVFPKSIYNTLTSHLVQPVFKPVCENQEKTLSIGCLSDLLEELKWADSVAIGCGLGNNDDTQVLVSQVLKSSEVPVVLDADGINCAVSFIDIIKDRKAPLVITPHPAEMARLTGKTVAEIQQDRIGTAKAFAKDNGVIVVLKGANTVVTDGEMVFVNTTGNSGMAMGGTGDMLTGMIASFIAQGISPFNASLAGVYIHGMCGDLCAREISQRGMTVEDMLYLLGALMSEFE